MAKKQVKQQPSELLSAIEFCMAANNSTPLQAYTEFCTLDAQSGTVYMSDGIIACGCFCPLELTANPHTVKLYRALQRMEAGVSITVLDDSNIVVKSGRLKAVVPTIDYIADKLMPDPPIHVGDMNPFMWALHTAGIVSKDKAENIIHASVLAHNCSVFGTDNKLLMECWHGMQLHSALSIPKTFINALSKIKKIIVALGYTDKTITVWFDDRSWVRSQLYDNCWPIEAILGILSKPCAYANIPSDLKDSLSMIKPFLDKDKSLILANGELLSSYEKNASSYSIQDLRAPDMKVNFDLLELISDRITAWDTLTHDKKIYFIGNNLRGALCAML